VPLTNPVNTGELPCLASDITATRLSVISAGFVIAAIELASAIDVNEPARNFKSLKKISIGEPSPPLFFTPDESETEIIEFGDENFRDFHQKDNLPLDKF
jgi:hypothetical protein